MAPWWTYRGIGPVLHSDWCRLSRSGSHPGLWNHRTSGQASIALQCADPHVRGYWEMASQEVDTRHSKSFSDWPLSWVCGVLGRLRLCFGHPWLLQLYEQTKKNIVSKSQVWSSCCRRVKLTQRNLFFIKNVKAGSQMCSLNVCVCIVV
jgi:hypothetical protein